MHTNKTLLALALSLILTGCGDKDENKDTAQTPAAETAQQQAAPAMQPAEQAREAKKRFYAFVGNNSSLASDIGWQITDYQQGGTSSTAAGTAQITIAGDDGRPATIGFSTQSTITHTPDSLKQGIIATSDTRISVPESALQSSDSRQRIGASILSNATLTSTFFANGTDRDEITSQPFEQTGLKGETFRMQSFSFIIERKADSDATAGKLKFDGAEILHAAGDSGSLAGFTAEYTNTPDSLNAVTSPLLLTLKGISGGLTKISAEKAVLQRENAGRDALPGEALGQVNLQLTGVRIQGGSKANKPFDFAFNSAAVSSDAGKDGDFYHYRVGFNAKPETDFLAMLGMFPNLKLTDVTADIAISQLSAESLQKISTNATSAAHQQNFGQALSEGAVADLHLQFGTETAGNASLDLHLARKDGAPAFTAENAADYINKHASVTGTLSISDKIDQATGAAALLSIYAGVPAEAANGAKMYRISIEGDTVTINGKTLNPNQLKH